MIIWIILLANCIEFNHTSIYEYIGSLTIYNSATNSSILSMGLHPTVLTYSYNVSDSNANLCFALPAIEDYGMSYYPKECQGMGNNTIWVTMVTLNTQNIINVNKTPNNVTGLMVAYQDSSEVDLENLTNFTLRISKLDLVHLATYYNNQSLPIKASISFECIFNCDLYDNTNMFVSASEGIIVLCTILWILLCNKFYSTQCQAIHKILTFFAIFKIIYWAFLLSITFTCPWRGGMENVEPYLDMLSTSVNTIFYTFLVSVMYMLSLGYSTIISELTKGTVNAMIFYMGVMYILSSIYYLASDNIDLKYTMLGSISAYYCFFLYKLVTRSIFNIRVLSMYNTLISSDDNMEVTCFYIKKKRRMQIIFLVASIILLLWLIFIKIIEFTIQIEKTYIFFETIGNVVECMYILTIM